MKDCKTNTQIPWNNCAYCVHRMCVRISVYIRSVVYRRYPSLLTDNFSGTFSWYIYFPFDFSFTVTIIIYQITLTQRLDDRRCILEFFINGAELSLNSVNSANLGNLINHSNMNWAQFKDPVFYMCLAGAVVASWSLTHEVTGLSPFTVMTNNFVIEFSENI